MGTQILIADDHPIVRSGLKAIIEADNRFEVIAETGDGQSALRMIEGTRPEIAILDVNMPLLSGFEVARQLRLRKISVPLIFLTLHSDAVLFNEAFDLGAKGYVLKESAVTDIVKSIQFVRLGEIFVSQPLQEQLEIRLAMGRAELKSGISALTLTERRVLRLIAAGKESKEIGAMLNISHRTVENHRSGICRKLCLTGHNALLHYAMEHRNELLF